MHGCCGEKALNDHSMSEVFREIFLIGLGAAVMFASGPALAVYTQRKAGVKLSLATQVFIFGSYLLFLVLLGSLAFLLFGRDGALLEKANGFVILALIQLILAFGLLSLGWSLLEAYQHLSRNVYLNRIGKTAVGLALLQFGFAFLLGLMAFSK